MLHFLGDGSAFNLDSDNTSAYFKVKDALILFDCGERICNIIIKKGLLEGVKRVHLFITHTHSDHIGSLEGFIYYIKFFTDITLGVYYPRISRLNRVLYTQGLERDFSVQAIPEQVEGYRVEAVRQKHMLGAYGYFFYGEDSFFFSGDTSRVNPRAIAELSTGKLDTVYHEVSFSSSPIHTPITQLEKAFAPQLRSKVYLMHFADETCRQESLKRGFSIVSVDR